MKHAYKHFLALIAFICVAFISFARPSTVTLTINVAGQGSVAIDLNALTKAMPSECTQSSQPCEYNLIFGETYYLEATAASGWEFAGWSGDISVRQKSEYGAGNMIGIYLDGNKTVTATFTAIEYELNTAAVSPGGGTITAIPPKDFYNMGDRVELTANANPGFIFRDWTGNFTEVHPNKGLSSTTNPILLEISGNTDITANFDPVQHAVPISPWAIIGIMVFILSFVVYRFRLLRS